MTSTLDELFDQIIHSERRAQERKNRLLEVKRKIQKCQEKLLATKEERESQRGRQVLKVQQLNEEELRLKWLTSQEIILTEQKQIVLEEKMDLEKKMETAIEHSDEILNEFGKNVNEFMKDFDLTDKDTSIRDVTLKDELEGLLVKETELSADIDEYEAHIREINRLTDEKEIIENTVLSLVQEQTEKDQLLSEEKDSLSNLEREKKLLSDYPHTNSEFCRLRSDLNHLISHSLEAESQKLQQEVNTLQLMLRRKQLERGEKSTSGILKSRTSMVSAPSFAQETSNHTQNTCTSNSETHSNSAQFDVTKVNSGNETELKSEGGRCETSNRLYIRSYPTLDRQSHTTQSEFKGLVANSANHDTTSSDLKTRSRPIIPKAIFKPKRKKSV
ncbi:coiled-coil domain-containing protein 172 isoform X2 [Patella vulgata]|uniref:coiled-coil domain-containing protein 172 isoform X2 n=1 Tax=Patella vulgata TaxID=6465 RepID=UPI00217F98D3|nr:coiled-coil domain-containing protein 172 isoform X2 [Patella vulgata]